MSVSPELEAEIRDYIAANAYGWCTVEKALEMASVIVEERPALCVEIGVYGGRSLIPQALALRSIGSGHVVGVDPWKNDAATEGSSDAANEEWWRRQDLDAVRRYCEESICRLGLQSYCSTVPWRSENARKLFKDGSVDVLHIDGNHTELASVRDVVEWLPAVRVGGFVWFDDIDWVTTQKALGMLDEKCERVRDIVVPNTHARLYRVR